MQYPYWYVCDDANPFETLDVFAMTVDLLLDELQGGTTTNFIHCQDNSRTQRHFRNDETTLTRSQVASSVSSPWGRLVRIRHVRRYFIHQGWTSGWAEHMYDIDWAFTFSSTCNGIVPTPKDEIMDSSSQNGSNGQHTAATATWTLAIQNELKYSL